MQPKKTNSSFLYGIVLVMMLTVGLALFMRSGVFVIQNVEIKGLQTIPESEISRLVNGIQGENLFLFDQEGL